MFNELYLNQMWLLNCYRMKWVYMKLCLLTCTDVKYLQINSKTVFKETVTASDDSVKTEIFLAEQIRNIDVFHTAS